MKEIDTIRSIYFSLLIAVVFGFWIKNSYHSACFHYVTLGTGQRTKRSCHLRAQGWGKVVYIVAHSPHCIVELRCQFMAGKRVS